jgi:hypothetical protein
MPRTERVALNNQSGVCYALDGEVGDDLTCDTLGDPERLQLDDLRVLRGVVRGSATIPGR